MAEATRFLSGSRGYIHEAGAFGFPATLIGLLAGITESGVPIAAAKKEKGTAILLSVIPIVGHLGFGRFFLGQTGIGILHIALMVLFIVPGFLFWIVDWFLIGAACDNYNREKAREIAVQVKALG